MTSYRRGEIVLVKQDMIVRRIYELAAAELQIVNGKLRDALGL